MIRTRPVYLESRVPLVNREPRADLDEYLGPAGAPHVDLIAIEANPDILVPFLLSDAATDPMDPAIMDDVWDFLDKADTGYEIKITNLCEKVKDLQSQIRKAMARKASLQAADWRRIAGVLPQAPASYIRSINIGASSSAGVCTDTSGTTKCPNYTGTRTADTSG